MCRHNFKGQTFSDAIAEIRCENKALGYKECPVGGAIRDAVVDIKLGNYKCQQGKTFGWELDKIWINNGCSAIFIVRFDGRCILPV